MKLVLKVQHEMASLWDDGELVKEIPAPDWQLFKPATMEFDGDDNLQDVYRYLDAYAKNLVNRRK